MIAPTTPEGIAELRRLLEAATSGLSKHDDELDFAARNALPALLDIAEKAARTCEWTDAVEQHTFWLFDGQHTAEHPVKHTECGEVARCQTGKFCPFCGGRIVVKERK